MIKPRFNGGRRGFLQKSMAAVAMLLPFGMKVNQPKPKFKLGDKVKSHLEYELPSGHYSVSLTGIIIGITYHAPIDLLPDYPKDIGRSDFPSNGYSYHVDFFSVIANGKVEDSYIGVFDDDKEDVTFDSEGNIVLMDKRLSN